MCCPPQSQFSLATKWVKRHMDRLSHLVKQGRLSVGCVGFSRMQSRQLLWHGLCDQDSRHIVVCYMITAALSKLGTGDTVGRTSAHELHHLVERTQVQWKQSI